SADGRHLVGGGTDLAPSGWSFGASAIFQPIYPFGIRGDVVYSSVQRRFLFSSNGGVDTADLDFNLLNIPLYLRFDLQKEGTIPYVYGGTTIGIVLKVIDNDAPDVVSQNVNGELYNVLSASADLGVGVAYPLAKKLGLNLDLRGSWALRGMAPRDLEAWEFDRIGLVAGLFYKIF